MSSASPGPGEELIPFVSSVGLIVPQWDNQNFAAQVPPVNTIWAQPLWVPSAFTPANFQINVTALEAAKNARCAVYTDRGNGSGPGALVKDSGNMSLAAVAIVSAAMGISIGPGLVWVCINTDRAATATLAGLALTYSIFGRSDISTGASTRVCKLSRAFALAAYPADESAQAYTPLAGLTVAVRLI